MLKASINVQTAMPHIRQLARDSVQSGAAVAKPEPLMKEEEDAGRQIADFRRRHVRVCCEPTKVYVHLAGYAKPLDAQMIEVSSGGMQLQVCEPLPVGTQITVDTGYLTVKGEVRHCQVQPGYFFVVGVMKHHELKG